MECLDDLPVFKRQLSPQQRHEFIVKYLPLVRVIAGRLSKKYPGSMGWEDLAQTGVIGLMDAMSKYDASKNATFRTYASTRIQGEMLDAIRQWRRNPHYQKQVFYRELDIISLVHHIAWAMAENPESLAGEQSRREYLEQVTEALSPRERRVLALYYGKGLTLKEVGALLGVDESRVSQIHTAAVRQLGTLVDYESVRA